VWRGKRGRRAGAKDGPVRAAASRRDSGTGGWDWGRGMRGGEGGRADAGRQIHGSAKKYDQVFVSTSFFLGVEICVNFCRGHDYWLIHLTYM
jgi:hypothetical protein